MNQNLARFTDMRIADRVCTALRQCYHGDFLFAVQQPQQGDIYLIVARHNNRPLTRDHITVLTSFIYGARTVAEALTPATEGTVS